MSWIGESQSHTASSVFIFVGNVFSLQNSNMTPHWYQLFTENGAFMGSDKVKLPSGSDISDFRKQVKAENAARLKEVDAGELTVYENMAAYENRITEAHMRASTPVTGGESEENALIVVVPNKTQGIEIY
jgi:hypothetical protein